MSLLSLILLCHMYFYNTESEFSTSFYPKPKMLVFKPDDSFPRMSSHTYTSAEQLLRQGGSDQKIE